MKKRIAIGLISILIVWLCYGFLPRVLAIDTTVYVSADAEVRQAPSESGNNYGSEVNMYSLTYYAYSTDYNRRFFIKFDVSSLSEYALTSVTLRIYCNYEDNLMSGVTDLEAREVSDSWTEGGLTWDNQPSFGDLVDTQVPSASSWLEWTVTDYVSSENEGDGVVSFCMKCKTESYDNTQRYSRYYTKEYDSGSFKAELVVEYSTDDSPFYSDIGDDGVTQVGEDVTVSCYWEDDLELNWTIVSHNASSSYENFTVSCSGNASWSNKTFQLSYTTGDKVGYLFYGQDNSSQWNSTGITYITTTPLYITFNLNNSTMGTFYVDLVETSNETVNSYDYDETVNLMGTPANSSFIFEKFSWSGGQTFTNPYDYTTSGNNTVWCYFDEAGEGGEGDITYLVLAVLLGVVAVFVLIYALSKR